MCVAHILIFFQRNFFFPRAMKSGVIHFKYSYHERHFTLPMKRPPTCCLIALLLDYLTLRGNHQGALFLTQQGTAVTRLLAGCLKHLTCAVSTHLVIRVMLSASVPLRTQHCKKFLTHVLQNRIFGRWKSNKI